MSLASNPGRALRSTNERGLVARIHPQHFPVVPVEIIEAVAVHEPVILARHRGRRAGSERLVELD